MSKLISSNYIIVPSEEISDTSAPEPTQEERIAALEEQLDDTDALLVELAYTQTLMELDVI